MWILLSALLQAQAEEPAPLATHNDVDVVQVHAIDQARKTSQIGKATFATGMAILGGAAVATAFNLTIDRDTRSDLEPYVVEAYIGLAGVAGVSVAIAGGITWAVGDARQRHLTAVVVPYTTGRETGIALSGRF